MPSSTDQLLLQSFYRMVAARPDALWLTQPMGGDVIDTWTRAQGLDMALRMAAHLRSMGLPDGCKVAIISKNCAHFILADLAIWMAGYVSVAIYPTLDAATVGYILDHSEAKAVFVGKLDVWDQIAPGVPEALPRIAFPLSPPNDFAEWDAIIAGTEPLADQPLRAADDIGILIYTSGSTGQPKGVMHDFEAMSVASHGLIGAIGLNESDRVLSYLPLAHAMERWAVECCSLVGGGELYFAESLTTFIDDLKRARPTVFLSVPRLWLKFQMGIFKKMPPKKLKLFLKIPILNNIVRKKILTGLGLEHVRFAASGSAPIPADLVQWYRDLGLELLEGYGMSENFCYSHVSMPGRTRVGYVGETYPGVDCKLGEGDEILVRSPANMRGYYKQPELSAASFTEDGFLKTGDRGALDAKGRLAITGRIKEIFKTSKGKYVAPAPIENLLNNNPHIELSCVSGSGMPKPYALIQVAEDLADSLETPATRARLEAAFGALLKQVNDQLPGFERLQMLVVVKERWTIEAGFLTPTMKIRRGSVEDAYAEAMEGWYENGGTVIFA
jgi:long-subunit acyl-CoA synthetase (AMP-forming)